MSHTAHISTPRLTLIPASAALVRLEMSGHDELGRRLGAHVPGAWPPPDVRDVLEFFAQDLAARPEPDGWRPWYWLAEAGPGERPTLVGSGGFLGPPDDGGRVEIGYGVLDGYQGRGYATEAVRGLVAWAFSHADVSRVTAEAAPGNPASVRVLRKNGFVLAGAGAEAGSDLYEWRRGRLPSDEKGLENA